MVNASEILALAQKKLATFASGAIYVTIGGILSEIQDGIQGIVNNLNGIATRAVEKINENGGQYAYEKIKQDSKATTGSKQSSLFSCDTDLLFTEILPSIRNAERTLQEATAEGRNLKGLEGCEDAKDVPGNIQDKGKQLKKAYNEVNDMIDAVEEAEKNNNGLIENLFSALASAADLFNPFEKDINIAKTKTTPIKTSTRTKTTLIKTPTRTSTRTPTRTPTKVQENDEENIKATSEHFGKDITYEQVIIGKDKNNPFAYTVLIPSTVGDGTSKPLIVWLHGLGQCSWDINKYADLENTDNRFNLAAIINQSDLENPNAYILCPSLKRKTAMPGIKAIFREIWMN